LTENVGGPVQTGYSIDHLPDEVLHAIENYQPKGIPDAYWTHIAAFSRDSVKRCAPVSAEAARNRMWLTSRLALWAWQSAGLPLESDVVFDPGTVRRFVGAELKQQHATTRQNSETRLLNMAAVLNGTSKRQPRAQSKVSDFVPYTAAQLAGFASWASTLPSPESRRAANAMLAFNGGAGLRAAELLDATVDDVLFDADNISIDVRGDFPRTVPVREDLLPAARRALEITEPGQLIVLPRAERKRRHLDINALGSRYSAGGPSARRLRATWICNLASVLPAADLVRAAGFSHPHALDRYIRHAQVMPDAALFDVLRNEPRW
jgi:integrase